MRLEGFIFGQNNLHIPAVVTLVDPEDNSTQIIELGKDERYTIDGTETNLRSGNLKVVFSSQGYNSLMVDLSTIVDGARDIHLQKNNSVALVLIAAGLFYVLYSKKKKVGAITTNDVTPFLLIAGAVLGFTALKKVLDTLGLGGNPAIPEQQNPDSPWKPGYWKKYSSFTYVIDPGTAKQYAETIHNAFSVFQDDYNAIFSVFSSLRTKANVSFLADIFAQQYNEDLLTFLGNGGGVLPWDGLSSEHLKNILTLVDKLPAK